MNKMIFIATLITILSYSLTGFFGYASFAMSVNVEEIMLEQNIFNAPYFNDKYVAASMFLIIFMIILSIPLTVLPCKDTIEELMLG